MNIITDIEETGITVYVIFKTFSSVKLEYNKSNGLVVFNLNNITYLYIND